MAATRTFTANFVGRTSNLEKSFKRVSKGSALMSDNLMRTTRMAGLGFAALGGVVIGAAAALKPMIDKAAAMEEALSKNQLLLGESSKAVEQFADTSLRSFGVTNLAALQATGVFASLGDAMGMSEEASASMATTLTGLAGDLSSLHDVSVETALTALRAGLIGEAEPLRKLGILLDAATIKTKALAMGLIKNTKDALTPAIKSQAAYALILDKGARAMGDFARTSDSATNATKILAGEWEQVQVKIGTALLPGYTAMINHLVDVILPAVNQFFDDPSWEQGALLSGKAAQSGFVKGFAGFTLALASAVMSPFGFVLAQLVDLARGAGEDAGEEAGTAMTRGFAAAIEQFGRDNPDWDRGDPADFAPAPAAASAFLPGAGVSINEIAAALVEEAAAATAAAAAVVEEAAAVVEEAPAAAAEPSAFLPSGGNINDLALAAIEDAVAAALAAVAASAAEAARIAAMTVVDITGTGPGLEVVGAAAAAVAAGPTDAEIAAWLGSPGAQAMFAGFTGDPGQRGGGTTVVINATAVTGQEVVDAMGAFVDTNGPLPPHWQQSAN